MTDKQIAVILAVLLSAITFLTLADYGVAWDEGEFYFSASQGYYKWLRKPRWSTIDEYWGENHEQPPVVKLLAGYSWYIFHKKLGLPNIISFRISNIVFVFIMLYVLFLFTAQLVNRKAAILATVAFFTLPRVFYHSHLVSMDYPVAAMWLLCVYSYWKSTKGKGRPIIYPAIFLGVALATKINAFFIYAPIIFLWLLNKEKKRLFFRSIPIFIIPPLLFFLLWPWLWKAPVSRFWEYISFHRSHAYLPTYYFGRTYTNPPWNYPFAITFLVVPLVVLVPFLIGIFCRPFGKDKLFIIFNAFLPLAILSVPSVPKYDGERLFLSAFPFICILYGMGLDFFKRRKIFYLLYVPLFILSIWTGTVKYHPYQGSYYNELAGGLSGALKKGMEADYWASPYKGILEWLNSRGECKIYVYEDPYPFSWYHEDNMLRRDITLDTFGSSKYMVLIVRQGFFNEEAWDFFKDKEPVYAVKVDDTPLVCVYGIEEKAARPAF